jgi:GNAT superfamily N-acetyltransferase
VLSIRPATAEDAGLLRTMIRELADFECELDSVSITEADLVRDGFGADPKFRAVIAEWDRQAAGYAFFFHFYSTWQGRQLFLEDLFVRPQFRGKGVGKALLSYVANIAKNENCRAMRWEVLDWNKSAIELYKSLGASFLDDWRLVLLPSEGVQRLAGKAA